MFYLHKSMLEKKFKNDRKLNLLRKNIITPIQFVNLIDENDDYIIFGPVILDKDKLYDFMNEWKRHNLNLDTPENIRLESISTNDIIENFDNIANIYPEVKRNVLLYKDEIKNSLCPKCTKNNHITSIVTIIRKLIDNGDKRDLGEFKNLIEIMIDKYSGHNEIVNELDVNDFDIEWIKPESINGIGNDVIEKLENCFECVIKHIGRAKILYEETITGYPDHKNIAFDEMTKGNKALDELYLKYMDSCAQLDMGSAELVGDIISLPHEYVLDIIDLANEIRKQRILFQADIKNVPDFDKLRLDVKKLELTIQTHKIE